MKGFTGKRGVATPYVNDDIILPILKSVKSWFRHLDCTYIEYDIVWRLDK